MDLLPDHPFPTREEALLKVNEILEPLGHAVVQRGTSNKAKDGWRLSPQLRAVQHVLCRWSDRGHVVNIGEFNDDLQTVLSRSSQQPARKNNVDVGITVKINRAYNQYNGSGNAVVLLDYIKHIPDPNPTYNGNFSYNMLGAYITSIFGKLSSMDAWDIELTYLGETRIERALRCLPRTCHVEKLITLLPPSPTTAGQRQSRYERLLAGLLENFGCVLMVQDPCLFPTDESSLLFGELACIIALLRGQLENIDNDISDPRPSAFVLTINKNRQIRTIHATTSLEQLGQFVIRVSVGTKWDLPATLESFKRNREEFTASLGRLLTAAYLESEPRQQHALLR